MRQLRITCYWLLRALAALGGVACLWLGADSFHSGNYRTFFFCWLCSGLLSGLFVAADHLLTGARVTWSDEITAAQLTSTISETEFNYGLVLRPFSMDADIRMDNALNPFVAIGIAFGMPMMDVQE
jgi:hypothetical protein